MSTGRTDAPTVSPTPETDPQRSVWATFSSLRLRDYRLLWVGILFMSAGLWIQQVTLGYLVYEETRSAAWLGVLNGLRALPFLIAGPLVGVMVDRFDRRRLLMATQLVLLVSTLTVYALVSLDVPGIWHLLAFAMVSGIALAINQPLRQALISAVVPKEEIGNAVALSSAGYNIMKIVGPAIAGVLIVVVSPAGNFLAQGAAAAIVVVMVATMRVAPRESRKQQGSAWSDMREGLAYVRRTPIVLALITTSLVLSVFAVPYVALMPVVQREVLNAGPEALGYLTAAPGVGAVISTLGLASIANRFKRKGILLLSSLVLMGIGLVIYAQMTSLWPALLALVIVGGAQIFCLSVTLTMLQMAVPDVLRGRVMSIAMMDRGLTPLGTLAAGLLADQVGAPATVSLMGLLVIGLTLITAVWVPQLRRFAQ